MRSRNDLVTTSTRGNETPTTEELVLLAFLFKSQSRREKTSSSKKAPLKTYRVLDPIRTSPFVVPTRKEAPTGNAPMGATPHKQYPVVFLSQGAPEAPGVVFDPTLGGEGVETPPPNDSSIAFLSPLVGGRLRFFRKRLANKQMFIKRVKHYHQWLRTAIPFKTKSGQISSDPIRVQGPSKDQALASCIQSLLLKNIMERVENVKSRVLQSPVSSTQASPRWRPVTDQSRLKTFLHVKSSKWKESIRTSLIPGEWVSSIDLSDAYLLIPIHPTQGNTEGFATGLRYSSSPPSISDYPQPPRSLQCL